MDVEEDAVGGEEDDVGLERAELCAGVEGGGNGDDGALLALVDWVEGGTAPDVVVGTSADGAQTRQHCSFPARSVWNASQKEWLCED